jgi:hypothetical protein
MYRWFAIQAATSSLPTTGETALAQKSRGLAGKTIACFHRIYQRPVCLLVIGLGQNWPG